VGTIPLHLTAKLFTLKETKMSKVILNMGYRQFVLDADKALGLLNLLSNAERYESKYHSAVDDKPSHNTYHVYPINGDEGFTITLLMDDSYNMYKMAGKPQD
jgi:hypothetical protein